MSHTHQFEAFMQAYQNMVYTTAARLLGNETDAPDIAKTDSENADHRRILEAALQKLPPAQRVPLVLFHFEGLSYEEVAARLKISLSKVKTDIHRGRGALRRKLAFDPAGESLRGAGPPPAVANPSLTPCRPTGKKFTEAP